MSDIFKFIRSFHFWRQAGCQALMVAIGEYKAMAGYGGFLVGLNQLNPWLTRPGKRLQETMENHHV